MATFLDAIRNLQNPYEFLKLITIGGHKEYHLEGDALKHTEFVWLCAIKTWGEDHFMTEIALLHDIGKIYSSIENSTNDWSYPDHSTIGSLKGVLSKFIPVTHPLFPVYQWYIGNHIKPLFWQKSGNINYSPKPKGFEDYCTVENLAKLALCDIKGSHSKTPQEELQSYLLSIILKGEH